jgi:hypothetical protein
LYISWISSICSTQHAFLQDGTFLSIVSEVLVIFVSEQQFQGVYSRMLPLIIMGGLSVAGALASVFLPETLNIHLPQSLEEGEAFGADFKIFSCPRRKK